MGAATERPPEVVMEDGLRKRKDGKSEPADTIKAAYDQVSSRVTPLTHTWKPSERTQRITVWVLLLVTTFFSIAVVVEELQASWYRMPALDVLNSQIYGAASLDSILKPASYFARDPETIKLRWNVTSGARMPDGVKTNVNLVNTGFPGPVIEARPGDSVQLDLINGLEGEELKLQFEGLLASSRGKRGGKSSQQAIVSGSNSTYEFQIPSDKSGTFMYRAISTKQISGGVFGAVIVRDPEVNELNLNSNETSSIDEERVLVVNEWYHPFTAGTAALIPPGHISPDSILINGVGAYNCSLADPSRNLSCVHKTGRSRPNMKFDANRTYRLRILNAAATAGLTITISGTTMTVIAVDGSPIARPKRATSVGVLRPGQRVDVLVRWPAGGDDEIILALDDESGAPPSEDATFALTQSFPIRVSGFINNKLKPPTSRYIDVLRLTPLAS